MDLRKFFVFSILLLIGGCDSDDVRIIPLGEVSAPPSTPSLFVHPDIAGVWVFDHAACLDIRGDSIALPEHVLIIDQFPNGNLTIMSGLTGETHLTSFQGETGFRLDAENDQCNETTNCTALGDTFECTHRRTCRITKDNLFCHDLAYRLP